MGAGAGRQFLLLLWKNWLLQKRRKVLTAFEIGLPVVMSLILLVFRQIVDTRTYSEPRVWDAFSVETFKNTFRSPLPTNCTSTFICTGEPEAWKLAYSPNGTAADNITNQVASKLELSFTGKVS